MTPSQHVECQQGRVAAISELYKYYESLCAVGRACGLPTPNVEAFHESDLKLELARSAGKEVAAIKWALKSEPMAPTALGRAESLRIVHAYGQALNRYQAFAKELTDANGAWTEMPKAGGGGDAKEGAQKAAPAVKSPNTHAPSIGEPDAASLISQFDALSVQAETMGSPRTSEDLMVRHRLSVERFQMLDALAAIAAKQGLKTLVFHTVKQLIADSEKWERWPGSPLYAQVGNPDPRHYLVDGVHPVVALRTMFDQLRGPPHAKAATNQPIDVAELAKPILTKLRDFTAAHQGQLLELIDAWQKALAELAAIPPLQCDLWLFLNIRGFSEPRDLLELFLGECLRRSIDRAMSIELCLERIDNAQEQLQLAEVEGWLSTLRAQLQHEAAARMNSAPAGNQAPDQGDHHTTAPHHEKEQGRMPELTREQHADFACDYLDELIRLLEGDGWTFDNTFKMQKTISEHVVALGLEAPFMEPKVTETPTDRRIAIFYNDPVAGRVKIHVVQVINKERTPNNVTSFPFNQKEQAEFRAIVERLKREIRRRVPAASPAKSETGSAGGQMSIDLPPTWRKYPLDPSCNEMVEPDQLLTAAVRRTFDDWNLKQPTNWNLVRETLLEKSHRTPESVRAMTLDQIRDAFNAIAARSEKLPISTAVPLSQLSQLSGPPAESGVTSQAPGNGTGAASGPATHGVEEDAGKKTSEGGEANHAVLAAAMQDGGKVPNWLKPKDAMLLLKAKLKMKDSESVAEYDRRVRHAFERLREKMPKTALKNHGKYTHVAEGEFKTLVDALPPESNRGRPTADLPEREQTKAEIKAAKNAGKSKGSVTIPKKTRWTCRGCGNIITQESKPERCLKCPSGGSFEEL